MAIYDEEPIKAKAAHDTLAFFKSKDVTECMVYLHKRKASNGTFVNDHHSTFDQFEKSCPTLISNPETYFVVDSAEPIENVKDFTETLISPHCQHWKEAVYEHCNKNANVALCSIPFPAKNLLRNTKIYKHVLASSIKRKDETPNYYELRM